MLIGQKIGSYEVLAKLGEGGMGEVWRARDTKLGRDVALKILPEAFAADPERVARFQREAQVLASLNHPNIAAIYGLEGQVGQDGTLALVMELVDGPTLAEKLPLPFDEALAIARQIADALATAHDSGIVHRDLKPANIKVRDDGTVKVLDFGLAKLTDGGGAAGVPASGSGSLSISPTIVSPVMATGVAVLMGTAAYMSPEQARGKAVDKRADIWAFGCVLYEMVTGERLFQGEDLTETLASVVKEQPDISKAPPQLHRLLRKCLEKDPKKRLRDVGDAWELIEEARSEAVAPASVTPRRSRALVGALAAALVVMIVVAAALVYVRPAPVRSPIARFQIPPPPQASFIVNNNGPMMNVSPDGSQVAFSAGPDDGTASQIWVRAIDAVEARPLPGTQGALTPFWSADGKSLAFFSGNLLKKIDVAGGSPQTIWTRPQGQAGNTDIGTWNQDGVILFSSASMLQRISATGGSAETVLSPEQSRGETGLLWPRFLPDGRHFIYFANGVGDKLAVKVGALGSKDTRVVMAAEAGADFAPPNHLVFRRGTTLFAQTLNLETFQLEGEPVRIADPVGARTATGRPGFSISRTGVLVFFSVPSTNDNLLLWFDRSGKPDGGFEQATRYMGTDLSPDNKRVAVHIHEGGGGDIWVLDLERQTRQRLTFDAVQDNSSPIWSPDGGRIAFASRRDRAWGIYVKAANGVGAEEMLFQSDTPKAPLSWSPDGKTILFTNLDPKTAADLWLVSLGDRKVTPVLTTPFAERTGEISPDGRWLAYESNESGRVEVFVQSLAGRAGKWQVSTAGGTRPRWRKDGRELFFVRPLNGSAIFSSSVEPTADGLRFGIPVLLFLQNISLQSLHQFSHFPFAVTRDGQRLLVESVMVSGDSERAPLTVVLNWDAALHK